MRNRFSRKTKEYRVFEKTKIPIFQDSEKNSEPVIDSVDIVIVLLFQFVGHGHHGLHALLVGVDVRFDGLVFFGGRLHRGQIVAEIILRHQALVLAQPGFAHARFTVETSS